MARSKERHQHGQHGPQPLGEAAVDRLAAVGVDSRTAAVATATGLGLIRR
ncbi:hypothetical protein [Streptomyces malaysiensis]|uniref:Uncharacterized protein n=1 Tax=Streptomyces malaysiensis TaxID=92644 RepID=A0A2J7YP05_STRMQ|nr:hypothetical protein [Streptomyces malaysiensis]PNG89659.1 hypothetical protein SMF913_25124 [Streptomyces malaysiensis]